MSQNLESPTHTAQAFMEFVEDLLNYTLDKLGYEWHTTEYSERTCKKIFKESFGEAIILFRFRHKREFQKRLTKYFDVSSDTIEEYSRKFCERTFKGKIPLMELITYFAFVFDTTFYFVEIEELDTVLPLVDEALAVFNKFVAPYFTVVGGWHALYRVAEQYVDFVILLDNMSASSSDVASATKL